MPAPSKPQKVQKRRTERAKSVRTYSRNRVARARASVASNSEDAPAAVQDAIKALDKAAGKGVIHPNNAARRKSRLIKLQQKQAAS
jgi:small subunit ribosomal protein S20